MQGMIKVLSISAAATIFLVAALNFLFPLPDRIDYSTIITDNQGEMVHAFLTPDDKWRLPAALDEISPLLRTTIIQKEDRYFYYHYGVNPFAVARAAVRNLFRQQRTSGASTITMQVARALEPRSRTYLSKLIEVFRACQLEWKYSKEDILQMYCNLLPYGGNIEGVKAASLLYFDKDPDHLSLAEITALCVIPNRPSSLVPGKHNEAIVRARNRWLQRFAREGVFTAKQIGDALAEPFTAERGSFPRLAPHLARRLRAQYPGTTVVSSIDLSLQRQVEQIVQGYAGRLRLKNIHNAAVVVIDNKTRRVVSYVGSADFTDTTDGGQVDGVTAVRQPGSTLKPLLYAMCIDEGMLTPRSVISDVPVNYAGYTPENFNKRFNGYVSTAYALGHSLNVPAVKSLRMLGEDRFIATLAACDFRQVKKDQGKLGLSMVLGGCGATLEELTGLYAAFARDGEYIRPSLLQLPPPRPTRQLVSPAATFMIDEILSSTGRPDFPLNWQATERMPRIAWKTGTSYGRRDAWSIGYNKTFTVGVWAGNFSGIGAAGLTGADIATPLLFRIFNTIDYDSDREWFQQPGDCDTRLVCSETGLPPAEFCQQLVTDYFIPLVSSSLPCHNRQEILVSPDEKTSYCRICQPAAGYKKKLYRIVPADMQAYYDDHSMAYERIPPHNPECEKIFQDGKPMILSPANGMEYLISRKHPEPLQLACRTGNDVSRVFWYVDNQFYKTGEAATSQFFMPPEGPVKISCTDDKGRNRDVWIKVKYVDL